MKTKISVIIPIYNVEKLLRETLDTCVMQDFQDVEFICINDGSTDSTPDIIREYAAKDSRFVVIDKENGGVSSARNTGLKAARGEWIMFLDADDLLEKDACRTVWKHACTEIAEGVFPEIIVTYSDIFPGKPEEAKWYDEFLHYDPAVYVDFHPDIVFEQRGALPFIWHQAVKRDLLLRTGINFDEDIHVGEDAVFLMKVYPNAKGYVFSTDKTYNYRVDRKGGIMDDEQKLEDKMAENHIETVKRSAAYWKEHGYLDQYGLDFLKWADRFMTLRLYKLSRKDRHRRANQIFDEIMIPYGLDKLHTQLTFRRKWLYRILCAAKYL